MSDAPLTQHIVPSDGVLPFGVDRVRDPLEQCNMVREGSDMAAVHVLWAGEEMVVAGGADAVEGRVDLGLPRDERGERGGVGLGHGVVSRGGVGDHQARGCASIKQRVRRDSAPIVDTRRRGSVDTVLTRAWNAKGLPFGRL